MVAIGVDLGGSRLRVGIVANQDVLWKRVTATEAHLGPDYVLTSIYTLIAEAVSHSQSNGIALSGIGVGSPGPLNPYTGTIYSPPNLPGWDTVPLAELVAKRFSLPVVIDNDANAAALAEWQYGAGKECSNMVYVTISTGIGGGVIAEGNLLRGRTGGVAEFGHMCMQVFGGAPCACGKEGCLEAYASGTGITRRATDLLQRSAQPSILRQMETIDPQAVSRAALLGDGIAMQVLSEASQYLGLGLANVLNLFDPEVLVLGGGLTALQVQLIAPALHVMRQNLFCKQASDLTVSSPLLGEDAGLIGAAALRLSQTD